MPRNQAGWPTDRSDCLAGTGEPPVPREYIRGLKCVGGFEQIVHGASRELIQCRLVLALSEVAVALLGNRDVLNALAVVGSYRELNTRVGKTGIHERGR